MARTHRNGPAGESEPARADGLDRAAGPMIPEDLSELSRMPRPALVALWPRVARSRRERPPSQRSLLAREIAWRVQERRHGGLDAATRRLLAAAIRDLGRTPATGRRPPEDRGPSEDRSASEGTPHPPRLRRDRTVARVRAAELPPSARLVRVWPAGSNVRHEVRVLDGGREFEYRGQRYASLTRIARAITGTHWSGPRFFGLSARRATP